MCVCVEGVEEGEGSIKERGRRKEEGWREGKRRDERKKERESRCVCVEEVRETQKEIVSNHVHFLTLSNYFVL